MKIILASSSPRRIELLGKLVKNFRVMPARIFEKIEIGKSAAENTKRLAAKKARAVFEPGTLTLGCDTLGELDTEVFGKPRGEKEAVDLFKAHKPVKGVNGLQDSHITASQDHLLRPDAPAFDW